jgi:tetratricopeptide (TPR) repeat protein
LGSIAHQQGRYEEAQQFYSEVPTISEQLGDLDKQANTLHNLGAIAEMQGHYEKAQRFYDDSLTISKQLDNQELCVSNLSNLGAIAETQGYYEKTEQFYSEALTLLPDNALLHRNHAQALIYARRLEEAEADLAQPAALDGHENNPYLWDYRAKIAIVRGEGFLADQLLDEVVKREASFDVALQRAQAAWLQGGLKAAQEAFEQVWENANLGERVAMRREMEHLLEEHPELPGRDALQA